MSDQDYGVMTDQQQEQVALALYQLSPDQLVHVLLTILATLEEVYGIRIQFADAQSVLLP